MLIKKIVSVILSLSLVFMVSGCHSDKDNPLHGKDTDERIVMCLENAYPEYNFKVVKSFDKQKNEGLFEDENGISFKVRDLLYDNIYHFGCCDEYLATILEKQDFFNKAKIIVEDKYQQKFTYDEDTMVIEIIYDDTNNQITTNEISQMISEVLNMADAPKVIYPDNQEFSTGVVNYYILPTFGILQCYIKRNGWGVTERFYVSDKVLEQSKIKEKIDKLYESTEK